MKDNPEMNPLAAILSTGAAETPSSAPGKSRAEAAPGFSPLLERAMRNGSENAKPARSEPARPSADAEASPSGALETRGATQAEHVPNTPRPTPQRSDTEAAGTESPEGETPESIERTGADVTTDGIEEAVLPLAMRTGDARAAESVPARVERSTERLDRDFATRLDRVLARMKDELGYEVRVTETFRSQGRQEQLYAQGRTAPGPTVTWTKNSNHTRGRAADVLIVGGDDAAYAKLAQIASEEGLRTLGAMDPGHIEMPSRSAVEGMPRRQGDAPSQAAVLRASAPAAIATIAEPARVAQVAIPGQAMAANRANDRPARPEPSREVRSVAQTVAERVPMSERAREVIAQHFGAEAQEATPRPAPVVSAVAQSAPNAATAALAGASHTSTVRMGLPAGTPATTTTGDSTAAAGGSAEDVEGGPENGTRLSPGTEHSRRARLGMEQRRSRSAMGVLSDADSETRAQRATEAEAMAWPLRDMDAPTSRVAAERASFVTPTSAQSSTAEADLRAALVSEMRQSLGQLAPAESVAGTQGTDIASRVARLLALQDAARSAPVSGVTLDVGPEDGLTAARIRLGLRGPALDALIDIADPAMANRLGGRVEELRRALERNGLEPASLVIRESVAASGVASRGANSGADNHTQQETGRQAWQQRRDPGAADDQKNRRNQKENAR